MMRRITFSPIQCSRHDPINAAAGPYLNIQHEKLHLIKEAGLNCRMLRCGPIGHVFRQLHDMAGKTQIVSSVFVMMLLLSSCDRVDHEQQTHAKAAYALRWLVGQVQTAVLEQQISDAPLLIESVKSNI